MIRSKLRAAVAVLSVPLLASACTSSRIIVPHLDDGIVVDGILDEPCYRRAPLCDHFSVASAADRSAASTKAWLFWNAERFVFAFECEDDDLVAAAPVRDGAAADEHAVDAQDRVELFLWSGRADDGYACIEIGALGAVHDYRARFYRRFDDAWSPASFEHAVTRTPHGYRVEAVLPRAAMAELGFALAPGTTLRAGLFRADFTSGAPDSPTWITWVDAGLQQPDFHVAGSFGQLVLSSELSPAK